jgi:hypothetical protein
MYKCQFLSLNDLNECLECNKTQNKIIKQEKKNSSGTQNLANFRIIGETKDQERTKCSEIKYKLYIILMHSIYTVDSTVNYLIRPKF